MQTEIDLDRVRHYMKEHFPNTRGVSQNPCLVFLPFEEADQPSTDEELWSYMQITTHTELMRRLQSYTLWIRTYTVGVDVKLNRFSIRKIIAMVWIAGYEGLAAKMQRWYDSEYSDHGIPILDMLCGEFGWHSPQLIPLD